MESFVSGLSRSDQFIGVVRIKGGDHEVATVKTLSDLLEKYKQPHLIVRKAESDLAYEPPGPEALVMLNEMPLAVQKQFLLTKITCPQVTGFEEAKAHVSAYLVDLWSFHESTVAVEAYKHRIRNGLPDRKIILTLGNDSGAVDYELNNSMFLCDRVILTMFEEDDVSWDAVNTWLDTRSQEERAKLSVACWRTHPEWSLDLRDVDAFKIEYDKRFES